MAALGYFERQVLEQYRTWHGNRPTAWSLFFSARRLPWTLVAVALIALWLLALQVVATWLAGLGVGIVVGMLWRDWRVSKWGAVMWPTLDEVLDWEKIDRLLAGPEAAPVAGRPESGNPYQPPSP